MSYSQKVSIIINNYNYARFLKEAIDSALNQTYSNTEVIVVDDGSTDNSAEIILSYKDRILPIFKSNGGMASTYNAAFPKTEGEVILILDSDDMLLPTAVAEALPFFDDPQTVKVHWALWKVDKQGSRTGGVHPKLDLPEGNFREKAIKEGPDCYISPPTSGNAWARWFLEKIFPMPEAEFRQHADTYLISLASIYGTIKKVTEPQGFYRLHGNNDYACKPTSERNRRNLEIYENRCSALSYHLQKMGIDIDTERWKRVGTAYDWMQKLNSLIEELLVVIPKGEKFILIDDEQFGEKQLNGGFVPDRIAIPFIEREGRYWGAPADDNAAISEFQRLRDTGASFIVFAWTAFWWLEHYQEFYNYVRANYRCVLDNERLIVFDLSI